MLRRWKDLSIAKKLYSVVGIMALLIFSELLTLRFAMRNLSAARAFVGGEGLWSKAQKNAVTSLQRYATSRNEDDYKEFLNYLKVPEGDHRARVALSKKNPDLSVVRQGFLDGQIHSDDIDPMVDLLRRFYWIDYLAKAIDAWTRADGLLFQLKDTGITYHAAILSNNTGAAQEMLVQIKNLNENLTGVEIDFSSVLGEGSRWLEHMVLTILTLAVLTVESIGLSLAFVTSRAISRGLKELNNTAGSIGQGNFTDKILVQSKDEIGQLGEAVNSMGELLRKSYGDLEERVQERTGALAKLAEENERLYGEAKLAVQMRDEFLSVASHELKTPLTALYLQLQRLARAAKTLPSTSDTKNFMGMSEMSVGIAKRITILLEELMDLTRIRIGKFELHIEDCDLVSIVQEAITHLNPEATRAGSTVSLQAADSVSGKFDPTRIGQVVTNLLSNAIKYGNGKPIEILVESKEKKAIISVKDNGVGIPLEEQTRIFERFERGNTDPNISGLGLGLYIAHQIIRAHGGIISVESFPDKGSTFTVKL